jgi:ABC-type uncharacterized transport system permease subunit
MDDAPLIDWPVFIGVTCILIGFAALATGRALASTWRPVWWAVFYAALLGLVDRFLHWSLFGGDLLSPLGYAIDTAVLIAIALLAYRVTQAARMVQQYPWLYRRAGLFSWRPIAHTADDEEIRQH